MERPAGGVIDRRAFHPIAFDQRLTVIFPLLLFSEAALPQFSLKCADFPPKKALHRVDDIGFGLRLRKGRNGARPARRDIEFGYCVRTKKGALRVTILGEAERAAVLLYPQA